MENNERRMEGEESPEEGGWQKMKDLSLEEVMEEGGFVREVHIEPGEDAEKALKQELTEECWWFNKYWMEKGTPEEQVDIEVEGNKTISLYNFNKEVITPEKISHIKEALKDFTKIKEGKALEKVDYILLDNKDRFDERSKANMNGYAARRDKAIKIYPKGIENREHRIEGISNFEGTVIHELSHSLYSEVGDEWRGLFWNLEEASDGRAVWRPKGSQKFVSNYALLDPEEDFCESMVAFLRNPENLDAEKKKFLDKLFTENRSEPNVEAIFKEKVRIPKIEEKIKYKTIEDIDIDMY